jgi:hypothetical protein
VRPIVPAIVEVALILLVLAAIRLLVMRFTGA